MQVLMLSFTVTAGCPGAGLRRLPLRPALQWLPQQRGIRRSLRLNSSTHTSSSWDIIVAGDVQNIESNCWNLDGWLFS